MSKAEAIQTRSNVKIPNRTGAKKTTDPFFAPAYIQPKLSIGPIDDAYEREADAIADKVMRMTDQDTINTKSSPITIQPKCAACEQKDLRRKEEEDEEQPIQLKAIHGFSVQRKCAECEEEEKQHSKPVSHPTLQRKCNHCEEEDRTVQRQTAFLNANVSTSSSVHKTLHAAGQPLDSATRTFMESRFNYDFSDVRIHNDKQAHQSSEDIHALAYTHGQHIVFAAGRYQPSSYSGKQLLAHELTHVIQQNGNSNRTDRTNNRPTNSNTIQCAYWTEPGNMKRRRRLSFKQGDEIHQEVLRNLGKEKSNADLFTEAPVPNADNLSSGYDKRGSADMYKASTTVGITFKAHLEPEQLPDIKGVYLGRNKYLHSSKAAPQVHNKVITLQNAPSQILVGELKPFGSLFDTEYQQQLNGYVDGYKLARNEVRDMAKDKDKRNALNPAGGRWNISRIDTMGKDDIQIPDQYQIGSTKAPLRTLVLISDSGKPYISRRKVKGRLYLAYRKDQKGIWNYVYAPEQPFQASQIPANIGAMQPDLQVLITPLRDVRIQPKINPKAKPINQTAVLRNHPAISKSVIQRKGEPAEGKDEFNYANWERVIHQDFIKKYKAIPQESKDEAQTVIAEEKTQHDLSKKFGFADVQETTKQKENDKLFKQIKFWANPLSSIIGRLRQIFGSVYIKIYGGVEKLKAFIKGLLDKLNAPDGGGIVGAVIKIAVKVFKFVGQYFFDKTIGLILISMKDGVIKKLVSFIESLIPDDVEKFIKEIQTIQKRFEESAVLKVTEIIDKLIGPYKDIFEKIEYIKGIADKAEDIITWVRWGARILACASPPAIGCLWALAESLLEKMAAKILTSCRVMKIIGPKVASFLQGIDKIKNIPIEVARFVIGKINSFLPEGWQDIFPLPPLSDLAHFDANYTYECGSGGGEDPISEEGQKILQVITEIGDEKFKAFLEMMNKRGAGPWVLLTLDRIKAIAEDLKNVSVEDLKKLAESDVDPEGIPVSLQELLKSIQKYTKLELSTRARYYEQQRTKAYAAKVKKITNEAYPANTQLLSDLQTLKWTNIKAKQYELAEINKNRIIYGKTEGGKRIGAYFRTIDTVIAGQKVTKIVSTSLFMNLDAIECGDALGVFFIENTKVTRTGDVFICASDSKSVFLKPGEGFESDSFINLQVQLEGNESASTQAVRRKADRNYVYSEQTRIHRKGWGSTLDIQSISVNKAIQSQGESMDPGTRSFMQSRFGYAFNNVRIHNDAIAHQSSADIQALAYTYEKNIVFGRGQYQPSTYSGKQLLAHELVHVIQQQNSATVQRKDEEKVTAAKEKLEDDIDDFLQAYHFKYVFAGFSEQQKEPIKAVQTGDAIHITIGQSYMDEGEEEKRKAWIKTAIIDKIITTDRFEDLAKDPTHSKLQAINPPYRVGSYCALNCPASTASLAEYLKSGTINPAYCNPTLEKDKGYGFDISMNTFTKSFTWKQAEAVIRGQLKKHGDFVVVEATRSSAQMKKYNLAKNHYFTVVNVKGKLFAIDAFGGGIVSDDLHNYIETNIIATSYRMVKGAFKVKLVLPE